MSSFQLIGLEYQSFAHLFTLSDCELRSFGAVRRIATESPGFPCRVSLEDAEPGEELLLLPYEHHAVDSPYRASGPIFVRRNAVARGIAPGELPRYVTRRLISLRAYDHTHMMVSASVVNGSELANEISRQFESLSVSYIHLHNAKPGCYSCKVIRG